ncbi:MAG: hypothetical protein OIF48_00335 [Silicimonas sp.]|nr:hypothetical protein [Silicimonas sp.]
MFRRTLLLGGAALFLAGCSGGWEVDYEDGVDLSTSQNWKVTNVTVAVPKSLTVSNADTYAPNADIVWHGEPFGDRRAQVARLVDEGITKGSAGLKGKRPVTIAVEVKRFHAVTPRSVARAPGAVHNIRYITQVIDNATGAKLTTAESVDADLEAYVGAAAVTAALNGDTQRVRIVNHLARVTRGWLGTGPDQRRTFSGVGR